MKRTLLRMVILLSIVTTACQTDEPELTESSNRLIVLPSGGKTAGSCILSIHQNLPTLRFHACVRLIEYRACGTFFKTQIKKNVYLCKLKMKI